jgi:tRNA pseudouridine55 synthase
MAIGRPQANESGLILISKPRGMTSFGVISRLRKLTGLRRIGHIGTLDPFADGLLPVCLGRATAAVQFMDQYDKTYRLGIEFGRATDTQDLTGATLLEHRLSEVEKDRLRQTGFAALYHAVAALPGEHQQTPPMYSAVKVDGRPLYEYARRGREIERKSRPIRIGQAVVESVQMDDILKATLLISCSKGTYIRTLADDLGKVLGFGAHAASLTRLKCGPFDLDQAIDLDHLAAWRESCPDQPSFVSLLHERGLLLPVEAAFVTFPVLHLPESLAIRLINGQPLIFETAMLADWLPVESRGRPDLLPSPGIATVIYSLSRLIGIVTLTPGEPGFFQLKIERVLIDLADFRQS